MGTTPHFDTHITPLRITPLHSPLCPILHVDLVLILALELRELALSVSTDPDHKFDLAIALNDLETALTLVRVAPTPGSEAKWKVVGDKALAAWQMDLARESFEKAGDLPALLLLFTSLSDRKGLQSLAESAKSKGQNNIAFAAFLQLGDTQACIDLLASTGRVPEAALFARSYQPSAMPGLVKSWKGELEEAGKGKIGATIASPDEDGALFGEGSVGEGSGVMVEKEDVDGVEEPETEVAEASTGADGDDAPGGVQQVVDAVKEPVEGLVEKVKDLTVGQNGGEWLYLNTLTLKPHPS